MIIIAADKEGKPSRALTVEESVSTNGHPVLTSGDVYYYFEGTLQDKETPQWKEHLSLIEAMDNPKPSPLNLSTLTPESILTMPPETLDALKQILSK